MSFINIKKKEWLISPTIAKCEKTVNIFGINIFTDSYETPNNVIVKNLSPIKKVIEVKGF